MAQQAVLLPRSDAARAYTEGTGQHLFIVDGSQLGRSPVTAPGAYQLPGDWLQVSGSHCKFSWSHEQKHFLVLDTSSNGTFVNNAAMKKGQSMALKPGDIVSLPATAPTELRFEFQLTTALPELQGAADRFAGSLKKRKLSPTADAPPAAAGKPDTANCALLKASKQKEKLAVQRADTHEAKCATLERELAEARREQEQAQETYEAKLQEQRSVADRRLDTSRSAQAAALKAARLEGAEAGVQEVDSLKGQLAKAQEECGRHLQDAERQQGSLAEVQQQLDEMQAAHKLLEQSLSTAAEQHAKALQQGKQDLEGEKVAHEGTKAKIARHQEALQTHIERAQTAEAVAEDLQAEIKQLTADAEDVKGTQQAARSKMASLQEELGSAQQAQQDAQERAQQTIVMLEVKQAALEACKELLAEMHQAQHSEAARRLQQAEDEKAAVQQAGQWWQQMFAQAQQKLSGDAAGRSGMSQLSLDLASGRPAGSVLEEAATQQNHDTTMPLQAALRPSGRSGAVADTCKPPSGNSARTCSSRGDSHEPRAVEAMTGPKSEHSSQMQASPTNSSCGKENRVEVEVQTPSKSQPLTHHSQSQTLVKLQTP